jgi:AraC-like DNA-binding protein
MSNLTGVSVHYVAALLRPVPDPGPLLRAAGIDGSILADPAARVPAGAYAALMRAVATALDDEFFGRDRRRMKLGSFAMLCHAVISCRSLQQGLARALRFYGLMLDDLSGQLREEGGMLRLSLQAAPSCDLFAHENLLLFLHRLGCWLINRRIPIEQMGLAFAEPDHHPEYRLIFGCAPRFDCRHSFIGFDARYGALPVVRDEAALKEFLALAPENLFVRYRPSHGTANRVRLLLAGTRPADWPSFAELAATLGMSVSTLHRRLAAEDSSFQTLKDQLRRDRASVLLRERDRSIMQIAEELGYAEASAFHRAFRKWTGLAPGEVRK